MRNAVLTSLRRLESRHAEAQKRHEEWWRSWLDGMLRTYSAPPWSREEEWGEVERLAARVATHANVREALLIVAAQPDA